MSNGINKRQNEEKSIAYLAAQKQLYNDAKIMNGLIVIISVILPFLFSFIKGNSNIENLLYVLSALSLFISFVFNGYIKNNKKDAAYMQLKFDIYVYQMPWDKRLFGKEKNVSDEVSKKSRKILKIKKKKDKLTNWYENIMKMDNIELNEGILVCQKENVSWDIGLRKRYKMLSVILIIIFIIINFSIGIIWNEPVIRLFFRISFVLPILKWMLDNIRQLNEDISNLKELNELLNSKDKKNMDELQEIEYKIYNHRKSCYIIPNFFYNIFKNNDKDRVHQMADFSNL